MGKHSNSDDDPQVSGCSSAEADTLIGITIDAKYRIAKKLGAGASGTVYLALDDILNRQVAVKVLHLHLLDEAKARERFLQESLTVASLDHQSIIKVYSRGTLKNGQLYIIMDYVEGEELSELLAREHKLGKESFYALFEEILDGLDAAHRAGVVHRDIKPGNIMLAKEGDVVQAKILDFGIAKNLSPQAVQAQTATGLPLGSSAYMSPEQCSGAAVDGRSDLYSLACVMYEALLGSAPFTGTSDMELMYNQVHKSITSSNRLTDMPAAFRSFLSRAMQKNPAQRYQSAEEMKQALLACKFGKTARQGNFSKALALLAILVLFALIPFYFMNPAEKTKLSKDEAALAPIRNSADLRKFLATSPGSPPWKIRVARIWISRLSHGSKIELRELGRSQEFLASYLHKSNLNQEAYELFGLALKNNDSLNRARRLDLMHRRAALSAGFGAYDEALKLYAELLKEMPSNDIRFRVCFKDMAYCSLRSGDIAAARKYIDWSMADYEGSYTDEYYARALVLSQILLAEKRTDDAQQLAEQMLRKMAEQPAGLKWTFASREQFLYTLAHCAMVRKQNRVAEQYFLGAIKENEKGPAKSSALTSELADLYITTGQIKKAMDLQQRMAAAVAPSDGFVAFVTGRAPLSRSYLRSGRYDLASRTYLDIVKTWHEHGEADSLDANGFFQLEAFVLDPLFSSYQKNHKLSEFKTIAESMLKQLPATGFEKAAWLDELANCCAFETKAKQAEEDYRQAIAALPLNSNSADVVRLHLEIGLAGQLLSGGKVNEADTLIKSTIASLSALPMRQQEMASAKRIAAGVAETKAQWHDAINDRREALNLIKASAPDDHADLAQTAYEMGYSYKLAGRLNEAASVMEESAKEFGKVSLSDRADIPILIWSQAGSCYLDLNKFAEASHCLQEISAAMNKYSGIAGNKYDQNRSAQTKGFLSRMEVLARKNNDASTLNQVIGLSKLLADNTSKDQ